jgi:hypothetical protein
MSEKVEFKGRFHPKPTDAGRQVSPPVPVIKTLVSVGEPQVSGPLGPRGKARKLAG